MSAVCAFGGSRAGANPEYVRESRRAGRALADAGLDLVYGGGARGIMGAVADGVWDGGGRVTSVIPRFLLDSEGNRDDRLDLRVVQTLYERKELMTDLSAGFLVLPGGLGTYDELFEVLTWNQLGVGAAPVSVLDVGGWATPLRGLLAHTEEEGFMRGADVARLLITDDVDAAVGHLVPRP